MGALGGNGGNGVTSTITGASTYYGGGGGGGVHGYGVPTGPVGGQGGLGGAGDGTPFNTGGIPNPVTAESGQANTGGGGGGSGGPSGTIDSQGGAGGSGLVVVRYLGASAGTGGAVAQGTSGSNMAAGYTLHTFTSVGASTLKLNALNVMLSGTIGGSGSMVNNATGGKISLMNANTYTGSTTPSGGTLGSYNMAASTRGALVAENNPTRFGRRRRRRR